MASSQTDQSVFVLQHVHQWEDGEEDVKMIGVYSTHEEADKAIERMKLLPGFDQAADNFSVGRYQLNVDHWTEGYVTAP